MAALQGRGGRATLLVLLLLVGGAKALPPNCLRLRRGSATACAACSPGYFVNGSGACLRCSTRLPGCVECNKGGTECTLCCAGHRLAAKGCTPCADASCLFCRADTRRCEECAEGFYATAAGECRLCDGCAGPCRADGTCSTTCLSGHGLVRGRCLQCASSLCSNCDGNRRACKRCLPLGYGLSRGRCKPCPLAGCEECADGLATCRTCTFRWVLRPDGTCQECDKGCHTGHCQPDGTCTKCTPGWGLVEGQCEQCEVVGAGEAEGNRCLNCDGDTLSCRQCGQGWGVLDYEGFEGACYQCFNATRFGAYGQCAFCDNDLARCSRCPPYTYLSPGPGKCLPCSKAMPKCRSCQDSRTCTDCWDGYALIKKRCVACPRGCADCGADPTRCARCDSSHVLDRVGKRCVPL